MRKVRKFFEVLKFDNPVELLFGLILFKKTSALTYKYKGVTALVDHGYGDQDGVRTCLVPGLYDALFETIGPDLTAKPLTILDLGANTGGFPLALKAHGAKIAKGVCVELNPLTCSRLSWNLAQNALFESVEVFNGAICGVDETLTVYLTPGSVGDSIFENSPGDKEVKVEGLTVDTLCSSRFDNDEAIDFCKIDIEGAEYEMFDSRSVSTLKRAKWLLAEIHERQGRSEEEIHSAIRELGFEKVEPVRPPIEHNVFLYKNTA